MGLFFKTRRQKLDQAASLLAELPPKEVDYGPRPPADVSSIEGVLAYLGNSPAIGSFLSHKPGVQCFTIPIQNSSSVEPVAWISVGARPPSKQGPINEVGVYKTNRTDYPFSAGSGGDLTPADLAGMGVTAKHVHSSVVKALSEMAAELKQRSRMGKG